jgi:hypothetical protein
MLFIKQQVSHALIYINTSRASKIHNILAAVRICYTNGDFITLAYTNMAGDKRGWETSWAPLTVGNTEIKVPLIGGPCMKDLVGLVEMALTSVRKEVGTLQGGKVFKAYRKDGKSVVEELEDPGAWL